MLEALRPIAIAIVLVCASTAYAGPWVHAPGEGYLSAGVSRFTAEEGMRDGASTGLAYRTMTYSVYAELGLPGRLQLTAYVPYVQGVNRSQSTDVRYNHDAVGDMRFALDASPLRDFPLAVGVEVKVPGYQDPSAYDSADGIDDRLFDPLRFPVLGDDNYDVTPRVQIGHSFYPIPMWAQMSVGYQWRGCRRHGSGCEDLRDGIVVTGGLGGWLVADYLTAELYTKATVNTQPESGRTVPTEQSVYVQGKLSATAPALSGVAFSVAVGGMPYADAAARGYDLALNVSWRF